jgi:predicted transcriptional regulator
MNKEDPLIAQVLEMKVRDYMAVKDIADDLGLTERQVYHYLSKAKAIGKEYNRN